MSETIESTEAIISRTESEIMEIIKEQEKEESLRDTHGFTISEFEQILKLEILDLARELKIVNFKDKDLSTEDKLNILKKQKFAVWFLWDGLNVVRVERGLIVNIYIHTSGKDIINNKDIWRMIRDVLKKCHDKEGGLVERTELEVRSKMMEWRISSELKKLLRQVITINDKEEEFDLVPDHRILSEEKEIYQVIMTDRKTGIKAVGQGDIKYRNQIDWGTKLELSKKVREFEFTQERVENDSN
jgi:hypothetical protein